MAAEDIAALSNGRATANTVRTWWRNGLLEYEVFPELGAKSNKRSQRSIVEQFLSRKYGEDSALRPADVPPATAPAAGSAGAAPALADLIDTLSSVKAAANAAMEALVAEAQAHAAISRAFADADAKRVDSLKHLQTMLRGYDLALSAYLQPSSPASLQQMPISPM